MVADFVKMEGKNCIILLQEKHINQQEDIFLAFEEIIKLHSPESITIDMSDIQRLNSNGIGRLVYLKRFITDENNINFSLIKITPQTLKTLQSVKVDIVLGIQS
jgi:anti-anti-sigma regulatory factor